MVLFKKRQKGFSLIELVLVMGLSSLAFLSLVNYELKKTQTSNAEAAGQQFSEVGQAVQVFLAREAGDVMLALPVNGNNALLPLTLFTGTPTVVNGITLNPAGRQYLPPNFSPTNIFGFNYLIQVRNNNTRPEAVLVSSSPVCEKGLALACPSANNPIKYDWIGAAMKKIGAQSGMTFDAANTVNGYNGGWTLSNADFNVINQLGQMAYRVVSTTDTSIYDNLYLRLDGTSVMRGNLNMGNFDIQNATNISYNGWAQGFGLLVNTVNSGTILNTGNIQTANLAATTNVTAGANPFAGAIGVGNIHSDNTITSNNTITAMQTIRARDVYLGPFPNAPAVAPSGRAPVGWLSDLLPKYSSRGMYLVGDFSGIGKPNCGNGIPKIEVVPQVKYEQGRVLGLIGLVTNGPNDYSLVQDQYTHSLFAAYANDFGGWWQTRFVTPFYAAPPNGVMLGLAHVYCDFNF